MQARLAAWLRLMACLKGFIRAFSAFSTAVLGFGHRPRQQCQGDVLWLVIDGHQAQPQAAAMRTAFGGPLSGGEPHRFGGWLSGGSLHRCGSWQQRPRFRDAFMPPAIAQQAVVPDFDKTLRQDVQAKPPHKLIEPQGHDLALRACGVVLVAKAHRACCGIHREQPPVTDGHTMRVAREIAQHLLRPGIYTRTLTF